RELSRGSDLEALKQPLRARLDAAVTDVAASSGSTSSGQVEWTFGTIEESFTTLQAGHQVVGHPGLVDEGSTIGLRAFGSAEAAAAHHRLGVRRLLALTLPDPVDAIVASLDNATKLGLAASPYPNVRALLADLVLGVLLDHVDAHEPVRDRESFDALAAGVGGLDARVRQHLPALVGLLATWREIDTALQGRVELPLLSVMAELKGHVSGLISVGFVGEAGASRLPDLTRYLKAVGQRQAHVANQGQDRLLADRIDHLQRSYEHRLAALPDGQPPTADLRAAGWMLEEFRVSLWAQQLGTATKVSEQRIARLLAQR
ncbi:MAG: DUF3418 domain-containing protein, partial [Myxococcales bacterium]